jgi:hypothetical protein
MKTAPYVRVEGRANELAFNVSTGIMQESRVIIIAAGMGGLVLDAG